MSGSGEAIPDEEALAILDERVESPTGDEVPDIGVVIDRPQSEASPVSSQQQQLEVGKEAISEPSQQKGLYRPYETHGECAFNPYSFSLKKMFGSAAPKWVVTANPKTPLPEIFEHSCGFHKGFYGTFLPSLRSQVLLRVMVGDSMADFLIPLEDLERSDLTLGDLMSGREWTEGIKSSKQRYE